MVEWATLKLSSAYHPETNGQIEVINRDIGKFLRYLVHEQPKKWLELLPSAKLWYKSTFNVSIGMTPFMALYGKETNSFIEVVRGNSTNLEAKEEAIKR